MSDKACQSLNAETNGIVNAYSWPTGMHNEGPEGYAVYYDPDTITSDDVEEALHDAVTPIRGGGLYLSTKRMTPGDNGRVGEDDDDRNREFPALFAHVFQHVAASDLARFAADTDEITWWNMDWDPESGASTWDDDLFLVEFPATGTLEIFFEVAGDSQYDAVLDMIADTLPRDPALDLNVVQGDSDGYYVLITEQ